MQRPQQHAFNSGVYQEHALPRASRRLVAAGQVMMQAGVPPLSIEPASPTMLA